MNQFDGYECKKMYYMNELFRFWFHNRYNLDTYSLNQPRGKQWRNHVGRRHWVVYYTSPQSFKMLFSYSLSILGTF